MSHDLGSKISWINTDDWKEIRSKYAQLIEEQVSEQEYEEWCKLIKRCREKYLAEEARGDDDYDHVSSNDINKYFDDLRTRIQDPAIEKSENGPGKFTTLNDTTETYCPVYRPHFDSHDLTSHDLTEEQEMRLLFECPGIRTGWCDAEDKKKIKKRYDKLFELECDEKSIEEFEEFVDSIRFKYLAEESFGDDVWEYVDASAINLFFQNVLGKLNNLKKQIEKKKTDKSEFSFCCEEDSDVNSYFEKHNANWCEKRDKSELMKMMNEIKGKSIGLEEFEQMKKRFDELEDKYIKHHQFSKIDVSTMGDHFNQWKTLIQRCYSGLKLDLSNFAFSIPDWLCKCDQDLFKEIKNDLKGDVENIDKNMNELREKLGCSEVVQKVTEWMQKLLALWEKYSDLKKVEFTESEKSIKSFFGHCKNKAYGKLGVADQIRSHFTKYK